MPKRRLLFPDQVALYHVINRIVRKEFWLDQSCRDTFVAMLRKQAHFAGLEIVTFCMMDNHFHLLVRVPPSALQAYLNGQSNVDDATLLDRYHAFYGNRKPLFGYSHAELQERLEAGGFIAEEARRRVLARMGDLSVFMRELKYRFITWFNDRYDNDGTIWSTKFKSVVVEDVTEVRAKVAAYIDLNPVRAGITDDPRTYRWSGFGSACAGNREATDALDTVCGQNSSLAEYARLLGEVGRRERTSADGKTSGTLNPEVAAALLESTTEGNLSQALRSRWRFFINATAIGSAQFLQKISGASSPKRPPKPKHIAPELGESIQAIGRKLN